MKLKDPKVEDFSPQTNIGTSPEKMIDDLVESMSDTDEALHEADKQKDYERIL